MDAVVGFFRFWYDFIIGDDWIVAAVVALALALMLVVKQHALWWPLPIVVIAVLGLSLWRATRA
jgi:hypothetical protein